MKGIPQLNSSSLALQLETSKCMEEQNNCIPQNIIVTDYDFDRQFEDQQFRNQLESIKMSSQNMQFKSTMDEFKKNQDHKTRRDNSSDDIETPQSNSGQLSQLQIKNDHSIQDDNEFFSKLKYSQKTLDESQQTKHFRQSATCKNQQNQNELYLSPGNLNKSTNMNIRSSIKENTIQTLTRSASKHRTKTFLQISSMINPAIQRISHQTNQQGGTTPTESNGDDMKKQGLNIIDYLNGKEKKQQKRNLLKQIYLIRKITNILKQRLDRKRIQQLQQQHYNVINDKSYFYQPIISKKKNLFNSEIVEAFTILLGNILNKIEVILLFYDFFKNIFQIKKGKRDKILFMKKISISYLKFEYFLFKMFKRIINYQINIDIILCMKENYQIYFLLIQTFSPDSIFIMCLNCIILVVQLIQLIVYPLKSAYQIQSLENISFYEILFYYIPISFCLFEICVHFNICYDEHGIRIKNKGQIFLNYSTNKFLYDIICIIIVQFNSYYNYFPIYLLFAIFSMKKILMNLKNINEHFQIEQRFSTAYDLINLSLIVFYMGHYCACGYYFIGNLNISSTNWITHYGFEQESWIFNYVNSIYFTFITMITVGFGDIAPINMYEKIYVIFMTVVSCGVFAYAVNTIGRIFSEMALKEAKYKNKKFEISKLMQQRNTTKKTQRKVLKFLEYEQNQEIESYQKGEEILLNISKSLRDEVNKEYFGKFLNDIKLFRLNFSKDFLTKLTSHIKEKTYGPNEIIFSQGDLDKNFYFICKGSVQLYMNSKVSQNRDDDFDLVSIGVYNILFIKNLQKRFTAWTKQFYYWEGQRYFSKKFECMSFNLLLRRRFFINNKST